MKTRTPEHVAKAIQWASLQTDQQIAEALLGFAAAGVIVGMSEATLAELFSFYVSDIRAAERLRLEREKRGAAIASAIEEPSS